MLATTATSSTTRLRSVSAVSYSESDAADVRSKLSSLRSVLAGAPGHDPNFAAHVGEGGGEGGAGHHDDNNDSDDDGGGGGGDDNNDDNRNDDDNDQRRGKKNPAAKKARQCSIILQALRRTILDHPHPNRARGAFRSLAGFHLAVLEALRYAVSASGPFSGSLSEDASSGAALPPADALQLIREALGLLAVALRDHWGNRKYFRCRAGEHGGWIEVVGLLRAFVNGCLARTGRENHHHHHQMQEKRVDDQSILQRLFGCILSCAFDDQALESVFVDYGRQTSRKDGNTEEQADAPRLEAALEQFSKRLSLPNPEALTVLFELWLVITKKSDGGGGGDVAVTFSSLDLVPSLLLSITHSSTHNLLALHQAGLLSKILPLLASDSSSLPPLPSSVQLLADQLLTLGVSSAEDGHLLYRNAMTSALTADTLRHALKKISPQYIHFDLRAHGFASVELPELGRTFPPPSSSPGYTLALWLQVVEFDSSSHTTLFGAFDATQSCFVLVYLERDTRSLILQTSVTSSKPSVRFRGFLFRPGPWYHVCIVHRRAHGSSSSTASLFVDGEFVEQVRAHFPSPPPSPSSSSSSASVPGAAAGAGAVAAASARNPSSNERGIFSPSSPIIPSSASSPSFGTATTRSAPKPRPVQTFFGTPRDLASTTEPFAVRSQWRLASSFLLADTLSDDLVAVYFQLGPRYTGNYQDCLGSFQTYRASAALNLRNETLHPGKEEASPIVAAIRARAGELVPEAKFLVNVSPATFLDDLRATDLGEGGSGSSSGSGSGSGSVEHPAPVLSGLSRTAARNLRFAVKGGRAAVVLNGAVPAINEALTHPARGMALLAGGSAGAASLDAVVGPVALDAAAWRVGGCVPVGLALFEAAATDAAALRALEILFGTVRESWRNSEAMEKENGFGVLGALIAARLNNVRQQEEQQQQQQQQQQGQQGQSQSQPKNDAEETRSDKLAFDILERILEFVGYNKDRTQDSIINNPLAYRILLVDLAVWRTASLRVQELYYSQFTTFAVGSKHHVFNLKRLGRMRITKKWLEALKSEAFHADTLALFAAAFRSLLGSVLATDAHRAIALFVSYAVHRPRESSAAAAAQNPRSAKARTGRPHGLSSPSPYNAAYNRSNSPSPSPVRSSPRSKGFEGPRKAVLSRVEVGIKILEMYADLLCQRDPANVKKFARTVTNKWLLNLLVDEEQAVIAHSSKILARVLVLNGAQYVDKFANKTGGFTIMRHRLRRWWSVRALWIACFAILLGRDIATIDHRASSLKDVLLPKNSPPFSELKVFCPAVLPVLMGMLQSGLRFILRHQPDNHASPPRHSESLGAKGTLKPGSVNSNPSTPKVEPVDIGPSLVERLSECTEIMRAVVALLSDVHRESQSFRDFTTSSHYVQEMMFLLFPIIVSSDLVSPETELNARDSALNFNGQDVVIRPISRISTEPAPVVRTVYAESGAAGTNSSRAQPLRRGSSFIFVTSEEYQPPPAQLHPVASPKDKSKALPNTGHEIVEDAVNALVAIFTDQILFRKDFVGVGVFMKVPPGFQEQQAYFETYLLRKTLAALGSYLAKNQKLLAEPRVLTNLQRFCAHLDEAVYEGWFINGADFLIDFLGEQLEYLQRPDIRLLKSIRLCSEIVSSLRSIVFRVALFRMSENDESPQEAQTVAFLNKLTYWQTVLFAQESSQDGFLRLFCYLLYNKLVSKHRQVREVAANLWRTLLVQKLDETSGIIYKMMNSENEELSNGFHKVLELDNESFLSWTEDHRKQLDAIFSEKLAPAWETYVSSENRQTEANYKLRVSKRREKLKAWVAENMTQDDVIRKHEVSSDHWRQNIYTSEQLKRQRSLQDYNDATTFNFAQWSSMRVQLRRPYGLLEDDKPLKWKLDPTEGRNRMRLRLIPDRNAHLYNYQAKAAAAGTPKRNKLNVDVHRKMIGDDSQPIAPSPIIDTSRERGNHEPHRSERSELGRHGLDGEDDFEIIEEPDTDGHEDKNRKVMRSLQRNDQVEDAQNVTRIIGLEACEGLLILGKSALYIMDNFFQRSDGEIVDVWQAPPSERDSYMQMISGREAQVKMGIARDESHETKSWRWEDVLSISKRRFLFRDVAIEVFFMDGQSYLLTLSTPKLRDEVFQKLMGKAQGRPSGLNSLNPEDTWRVESLRTLDDNPQSIGSRFTSVFAQGTANPSTKKWVKGEISNFHYLMLVNTMAGRTFNDLTQYPVFPWVLADYTSQELDFSNPRTFRDLSKPMGCQTPERQAEFRERYDSFAEMGDHNPFHYGTHYSSAMIVTSYLIRLQPFVQSYLLLQGGSFDHPDRLFFSIERAWNSASRENMTDVRELIPEFYYLPEMFVNANGYDFGLRQAGGGKIDNVALPPWAKGDPKIFVAKHREALESEYVSRHLHQWIDLVFGHKQRGEAAREATNIFHHLSYSGAKNLDEIDDPVERMATIGIIHNFGQTPHQIFHRAHPARGDWKDRPQKLDSLADTLTRLPSPLLESNDKIASILYSPKTERLLCSGPFRLNIPPTYDKYMEWGYTDGSIRFFHTESSKLVGVFEHVHDGQLSAAMFADSRTLVTAGEDCTIALWTISATSSSSPSAGSGGASSSSGGPSAEPVPKGYLFGHRSPVTVLSLSRSFSTLVSASQDGTVLLWDLNRRDLVRVVAENTRVDCARVNDTTGTIALCGGPTAKLFTLNGEALLEQHVCAEGDECVTTCAFYEGSGNDFLEQDLFFTGHRRGTVNIWNLAIHDGKFVLEHVKRMNHLDPAGFNIASSITCILPMSLSVYTGDDDGRVYEWNCIQRQ